MIIDWTAISAIFTAIGSCSTGISLLVLVITLFYIQREVHQARVSTYAGAYKSIVEILQAEEIRTARRYLFKNLEQKTFEFWNQEDRREAEKVCHTYDAVGQMVRYGFIPRYYVVDSWGASLRRTWAITMPLVYEFRQKNNSAEIWDDYEWLAKEAKPFQKPLK
jgi:hypothetical protein